MAVRKPSKSFLFFSVSAGFFPSISAQLGFYVIGNSPFLNTLFFQKQARIFFFLRKLFADLHSQAFDLHGISVACKLQEQLLEFPLVCFSAHLVEDRGNTKFIVNLIKLIIF